MKASNSTLRTLLGRDLAQQIAALGLVVAMLGLGYDVWLHAREGEALADEAIFGLSNPGHVIFGAGLVLTAAGLLLGLVTSNGQRRAPLLSRLTAALLVTVMGGVLAFGFTSPQGHHHGETHSDSEPPSVDLTKLGLSQEEMILIETSRHSEDHDDHGPELALGVEDLVRLGDELAVAREAGVRYTSLDYALANGYVQIVQDLPLIGAHFINPRFAGDRGKIDFSQPEMLIYTFRDGAWLLYGLSYLSGTNGFEGEVAPEGFTGPFDVWHWHKDWCFTLHGARAVSRDECAKIPGFFVDRTGYMVHVWLVENPNGPFAHAHPGLTGSTEYIVPQFLTGAVPGQTSR